MKKADDITGEVKIKQMLVTNDPAVLAMIYDFAGSELYSYLGGLTGSTHDAEELLNDLFIRIVDKREKLAAADNMKAYLFRMAANLAYDRMRESKKYARELEDYAIILSTNTTVDLADEENRRLDSALATLPQKQREVVAMKFFMKKTFEEIAATLGISRNTVISRYRYALQKLKVFLENNDER